MRTARRVLVLALSLAVAHDLAAEAAGETTVAMLEFDLSGVAGASSESGTLLAELVAIELSRSGSVRVLERERLADLLRERERELSGEIDSTRTLSSGRMLGARFLVSARAFSFGGKVTATVSVTSTDTGLLKAVVHEAAAGLKPSEMARDLALKVRDTLADRKAFRLPGGSPTPDSAVSPGDQRRGGGGRVRVVIRETTAGNPSGTSVAEDELDYLLARESFEVFSVAGERREALPSSVADLNDAAIGTHLKDVDIFIFGVARAAPGRRTGDLISARAELTLKVCTAAARGEPRTVTVRSMALDVSPPAAARGALRRVAGEALKVILPELVESAR